MPFTFEQNIEAHHLCAASKLLIERETRLFVKINEEKALKLWEEEVDKLAADRRTLEDLFQQTLRQSLSKEEANIVALMSAMKAVHQEEEQDQLWKQRGQTPPAWRPSNWRTLHDSTLRSLVEERLDNPSTPVAVQPEQSSLHVDIQSMGRQLKEDLLLVVDVVKCCYPPELNICQLYASFYHQTFSTRLRKIADFGLEDKDCTFLLRWVNEYYPG